MTEIDTFQINQIYSSTDPSLMSHLIDNPIYLVSILNSKDSVPITAHRLPLQSSIDSVLKPVSKRSLRLLS
jgi:hypothetical protein